MLRTELGDRLSGLDTILGQSLYHATPLHYLPMILQLGALLAASASRERGVQPRKSAMRRDRMLGVDQYVHLALDPFTPLLKDKLAKGMPHVLLKFDGSAVLENNRCSALPCNTKAWRSRASLSPIEDYSQIANMLRSRASLGRYPSMEILVPERLSLNLCESVWTFYERDRLLVEDLNATIGREIRVNTAPDYIGRSYRGCTESKTTEYVRDCIAAGEALALPQDISFD